MRNEAILPEYQSERHDEDVESSSRGSAFPSETSRLTPYTEQVPSSVYQAYQAPIQPRET